jgi:hypothetical protein
MGAGLSQKQIYTRTYNRLQRHMYDLRAAGVDAGYSDRVVKGQDEWGNGFSISYKVLRASNGEVAGLPTVSIVNGGKRQSFEWLQFERGLDEVKKLFTKTPSLEGWDA